MFSVELAAPSARSPVVLVPAEEAMRLVNRLRALRIDDFIIRDQGGTILDDRQLAMIVMAARFLGSRQPVKDV